MTVIDVEREEREDVLEVDGLRAYSERMRRVLDLRRHPTQGEVLELLLELRDWTGEDHEWSPVELAPMLGQSLGTMAYHVRMLHKQGILLLTRRSQVRGAAQHHYVLNLSS